MFRIIVVDDEDMTRIQLKKLIDQKCLGVTAEAVFSNGKAALEHCRKSMPDIVLTDVRMPKMDGIELACALRKLSYDCKIIFLSGFADKEYLKSAINLRALTYIEKPIQPREVVDAVLLAISQCDAERAEKNESDRQKHLYRCGLPLLYQQMALAISSGTDKTALLEKYGAPYANFSAQGPFTAACFLPDIRPSPTRGEVRSAMLEHLYNAEHLIQAVPSRVSVFDRLGQLLVIERGCITSENYPESSLASLFGTLSRISPHESLSLGISRPVQDIGEVSQALTQAAAAARHQFYRGVGQTYFVQEQTHKPLEVDEQEYKKFRVLLKDKNETEAMNHLHNLFTRIDGSLYETDSVRDACFRLLLEVFSVSQDSNLIAQQHRNSPNTLWREVCATPTWNDLKEIVTGSVYAYIQNTYEKGSISKRILQIQQFIQKNFETKTLSIHMIASQMYLSHTYLCALFKKATGQTVNEYVTNLRMEKAKQLLADPKIKVYEIADQIGISDNNYFSARFKKHTGCTPTEYRESRL